MTTPSATAEKTFESLCYTRELFALCVGMLATVGQECEKRGDSPTARKAYAVACVLLDQVKRADQVIAVKDNATLLEKSISLTCSECVTTMTVQMVMNLLLPDEEGKWVQVNCVSCGADLGHFREDAQGGPVGFEVSITGTIGTQGDTRTLEERKPELLAMGFNAPLDTLPPMDVLRENAVLGTAKIAGFGHGQGDSGSVMERLELAKSKIAGRTAPKSDDDF